MRWQTFLLQLFEDGDGLPLRPNHAHVARRSLHRPAQHPHIVAVSARHDHDVRRLAGRKLGSGFIEIVGDDLEGDRAVRNRVQDVVRKAKLMLDKDPDNLPVVEELIAKAPRVVPGEEWQVHYAFFARSGFTEEARQAGQNVHALMVDLEMLDNDLQGALEK